MRSGACALVVGGSLTIGGICGLSLWKFGLRGAMVGGVLAGAVGGAGVLLELAACGMGVGLVGGGGTYSGRSGAGAVVGCFGVGGGRSYWLSPVRCEV